MIPYLELPAVRLFGAVIHPFTWLVALAMVLTFILGQRRVRAVGLYPPIGAAALLWVAMGGFIGAHVVEILAYQPARFVENPLSLLELWEGMSSFGGFIGGTVALYLFGLRQGVWILPYLDALVFGFTPGFIVARSGCYVSHDHPGTFSDFVLAVAYPGGARHDLGFYEMLLAAAITAVLYLLPKRPRFVGFYTALVMALYAPARFLLDFLRVGEARYLGLTPAQYFSVVMLLWAAALWLRGRKRYPAEEASEPPQGSESVGRPPPLPPPPQRPRSPDQG